TDQVRECERAGARIIVAPDTDAEVISTALEPGLTPYPGAATPTEAFAAIKAGATKVKLFPSSAVGISGMKAWSEVLPDGTELFPVGGVGSDNAAEWRSAGAAGLGLGSSLYRRGDRPDEVRARAEAIASAWARSHRTAHRPIPDHNRTKRQTKRDDVDDDVHSAAPVAVPQDRNR